MIWLIIDYDFGCRNKKKRIQKKGMEGADGLGDYGDEVNEMMMRDDYVMVRKMGGSD